MMMQEKQLDPPLSLRKQKNKLHHSVQPLFDFARCKIHIKLKNTSAHRTCVYCALHTLHSSSHHLLAPSQLDKAQKASKYFKKKFNSTAAKADNFSTHQLANFTHTHLTYQHNQFHFNSHSSHVYSQSSASSSRRQERH